MVKRISQQSSELSVQVRFLVGAQKTTKRIGSIPEQELLLKEFYENMERRAGMVQW